MEPVHSPPMNGTTMYISPTKINTNPAPKHIEAFEFLVKAKILIMSPKPSTASIVMSSKSIQTSNLVSSQIYLPGSVGGSNLTTPPSYAPSNTPVSKPAKKSRKSVAQKRLDLANA